MELKKLRTGAAADLLRVPAAAADRAGAGPRSNRPDAEKAAMLAPVQGPAAGLVAGRDGCRGGADAGTRCAAPHCDRC